MASQQEVLGREETVRISADSFEESPFISRTASEGAVRGVYAGRYHIVDADEDVRAKYWRLRQQALLFDTPEKPWDISGPDAVPFLERLFCRKVAPMREGRAHYAIACTAQGGVFMDGLLFRLGPDRFRYVQADGAFEAWMTAHRAGFDVDIRDPRSRVLQIQGPASLAIMQAASDGAITGEMTHFSAGTFDLGGQALYVSRSGFTGELGFEVYCEGAETNHLALWDHLIAAGAPHGLEYASARAMTLRRVEAGIRSNGADMDPSVTPFEAGLGWAVDMENETFIGRAALAGRDRGRRLFGLTCDAATPVRGCTVRDGDRSIGKMTVGVPSPTLECGVGFLRLDQPGEWTGRTVTLVAPDGAAHDAEIVDLPFFDAEHDSPRGRG